MTFAAWLKAKLASDIGKILIRRAINGAALFLVGHGALAKGQSEQFIEVGSSIALWALDWALDHWHIKQALSTPAPGQIAESPKLAAQRQNAS